MKPSLSELDLREFGDWPLMHRATACLLLALLVLGSPWVLLTRPTFAQWQALKSAESELQARLLHARQRVDALPALPPFTAEEPPPPSLNVPALIPVIAETAQAAGLHGAQFRPQLSMESGMESIPVELHLHGTWPQFARFAVDLATPASEVIVSLRDIRLRAQPQVAASTPLLELSATVWIHPRPGIQPIPALASQTSNGFQRNPFIDSTIGSHQTNSHAVIGSLDNGQEQVGLILTPDGGLRRVRGSTK